MGNMNTSGGPRRLGAVVAVLALVVGACAGSGAPQAPGATGGSPAATNAGATSSGGSGTGVSDKARSVPFKWGTFTLAQRIGDKAAKGDALNVVVDNQGTAIPVFGAEQRIGVDRGCAKNKSRLNISCRLAGPASTDQTAQLAELETLLSSNQVDCLGLQSPIPDAYVDIINKYVAAGVPVFTQNSDVPNSQRFAFFALNERDAGKANGAATANIVKAKGLTVKQLAVGSGNPTAPWAQDRMAGFMEGYKSVIPDAKFFNNDKNGLPTGENFTTQEVIDSVGPFFTGNPDVNLFFHTDQGVEGVGQVITDKKLTGNHWTSGFNVSLKILDSIDAGDTLVTINQGFDNQAEAAVSACVDFLKEGKVPTDPLAYLQPIIITKDGEQGETTSADARKHLVEVLGSPSP